jgi:diadenosine tetraphosphatase ApaH/serine/threonine PP2A family protein phosphatase
MHREAERLSYQTGRDIVMLENESRIVTVNGIAVRLVGATLWTDYALLGDPVRHRMLVARALNDYRCIRGAIGNPLNTFLGGYSDFSTVENLNRHDASREFFERILKEPHDGPTIVLTHHLPSLNSVSQRYKDDPVSAGFASRMDDVLALKPTLWVHGHTHDPCTWRAPDGTLVVCNPAGYAYEITTGYRRENEKFNPKLVVDIRKGAPNNDWKAGI